MSRLDFCESELVDDCYDWKNDHCDGCNIFKAYCEGARRAKNSIVRCKDCDNFDYAFNYCNFLDAGVDGEDFFSAYGERREL